MAVSDNLYISDLPPEITDAGVQAIFGAYGNITSLKVIPPKQPGQKGAALVRFGSVQEASWIVDNLNGNMPEGLNEPIQVKYANSGGKGGKGGGYGKADGGGWPEQRPAPYAGGGKAAGIAGKDAGKGMGKAGQGKAGGGGGNGIKALIIQASKQGTLPGGGPKADNQCVYIKGLPSDTTDLELYKLCAPFGAIAQRGVTAMHHPDGTCTSIGFVDFLDAQATQACINTLQGLKLPDGTELFLKTKNARKGGAKGDGKKGGFGK